MNDKLLSWCRSYAVLAGLTFALAAAAMELPSLSAAGLADWQAYQEAESAKAFALAPGGARGWSAAQPSSEAALGDALARCQAHTVQRCLPWAVDRRIVFDFESWRAAWMSLPGDQTTRLVP